MTAVGQVRRMWGVLGFALFMVTAMTSAAVASEVGATGSEHGALASPRSTVALTDVLTVVGGLLALAVAILVAVGGRRYQLARGAA